MTIAQADPFAQYPGMEVQSSKGKGGGKGKGNPHNPVPESDATGALLILSMLTLFVAVRLINRWGPRYD